MKNLGIFFILSSLSGLSLAQAGTSSAVKALPAPNPTATPSAQEISIEGSLDALNTRLRKLEKEVALLKTGKINVPLDEPYVSSEQLLSWVSNSILTIYTYSYANYSEVLKNIRYLFTQDGYDSYVKALESSGNLQMIQENKWIVTSSITGTPRILKEGIADKAHLWEVELPLTVNFENATTSFKQNMLLNLQVSRVDQSVNAQGIAIQSITAQLQPTQSPADLDKLSQEPNKNKDSVNPKETVNTQENTSVTDPSTSLPSTDKGRNKNESNAKIESHVKEIKKSTSAH